MENRFMQYSDRGLTNSLYVEAFEAANLKWPHAYMAAYKSMCTLNTNAQRFIKRYSVISVLKFLVMIFALLDVLLLLVAFLPINTLDQRIKALPFFMMAIVIVMLILRYRFYNQMRHDLLFAENKRQALEHRWPGISELVQTRIKAHDFNVPDDPSKVLDLTDEPDLDKPFYPADFIADASFKMGHFDEPYWFDDEVIEDGFGDESLDDGFGDESELGEIKEELDDPDDDFDDGFEEADAEYAAAQAKSQEAADKPEPEKLVEPEKLTEPEEQATDEPKPEEPDLPSETVESEEPILQEYSAEPDEPIRPIAQYDPAEFDESDEPIEPDESNDSDDLVDLLEKLIESMKL